MKLWIHLKENQQLKCLNYGSSHPENSFIAIFKGVFGRLKKLTSTGYRRKSSRLLPNILFLSPRC